MGIYIKNMVMPISCNDCPLAGDFKCNLMPSIPALCKEYDMAVQNGKRLNNCPLVEIPPHGRLIDADALKASLVFAEKTAEWAVPALRAVLMVIDEMPTIIEAKEGE